MEKNLVLSFGLALRDRLEKSGKYRVVMTRTDDTFIALADRVKVARNESAALFISIHADALKRGEGDAQGATI
jgi:N-acetylmuramoyl-L-alanine amidase